MKRLTAIIVAALGTLCADAQETLPYQNPNLTAAERAADLCSRLTLDEKKSLMMNGSPAIPRLGIPKFDWWSEALHGVGRNGLSTTFPSCIGMASSFNVPLIEQIYTAVSDEARAKNTELRKQGEVGKYQCLSFWTPTINIFRDPRWGRGQESYGEDVYLNSIMGQAVVRGLQGTAPLNPPLRGDSYGELSPSPKGEGRGGAYYKLLACAKHFAVHSGPEKTRHKLDITTLSSRDLYETYLPAFKDLVQKAGVAEVMCAYQRFEGEPCCGSNKLLQQILRDEWGFQGLVVSDCGAVSDFWRKDRHHVVETAAEAAAKGAISGTDVECGSTYSKLTDAVKKGLITEEQINTNVLRLLEWRFKLGDFDPDEMVEWTKIPASVVNCKAHRDLALEAARQQMVLLQNKNNILPLKKDASKIVVMGPNAADSIMLWGIYYGQPGHTVTILEGIENKLQAKATPPTSPQGRLTSPPVEGLGEVCGSSLVYDKACELTELKKTRTLFGLLKTPDGQPGMAARYWDNPDWQGEPILTKTYTTPLAFDGGGDTAFEGGVPLFNFSASYEGILKAEKTEEIMLDHKYVTALRVIVNGDTLMNRKSDESLKYGGLKLKTKAGETYNIKVDYANRTSVAALAFNLIQYFDVTTADIVAAAGDAETVIFVGGISPLYEREETSVTTVGFDRGDRTSIELPEAQRKALKALHDAGKKIVFVNCSGSAVALTPETETCDAILQAWYAGEQGGHAVAEVLFGDYNPSGKLPVTFYKDDSQIPAGFDGFEDYSMKNRTYRYFTGEPLWAFGYGLSYTTYQYGKAKWNAKTNAVELMVKNTGKVDGTEIVQVYVKDPTDIEGPIKTLRGHARVGLKAGETKKVTIEMPRDAFELWDTQTNTMRVKGGKYQLFVGNSSDDKNMQTLTVKL